MKPSSFHLRQVLHRATASYLKVSAAGFHVAGRPSREVEAKILQWSDARTRYVDRYPTCRSLDGVVSITHPGRECDGCPDRAGCTDQVHLELLIGGRPYRLLLAYTSAANFLGYAMALRAERVEIEMIPHRLSTHDRGRFVEIRFTRHP